RVAHEPGRADALALERQHQPHAVAAERVDVLGDRTGSRQLAAEARPTPSLPDDIAIWEGASTAPSQASPRKGCGGRATARTGRTVARLVRHSSSPRAAFAR